MSVRRSNVLIILAPSFLSGLASVIFSVSVIAAVLTPFLYLGSYLEQYRQAISIYSGNLQETYGRISEQLNSSEVVANIVVFCAWAVVGFAVYYLVLSFLSFFINVVTFTQLLGFKNSDKKSIIIQAFEQLLVRTAGLAALALFLLFAFQVLVPVVPTLLAAALSSPPVLGAVYVLAAAVFLIAGLHVVVVLLRVIFLRIRLIPWMYDTSGL